MPAPHHSDFYGPDALRDTVKALKAHFTHYNEHTNQYMPVCTLHSKLPTLIAETTLLGRLFQMFTIHFKNIFEYPTETGDCLANFIRLHLVGTYNASS